jgi:hypothetical protein
MKYKKTIIYNSLIILTILFSLLLYKMNNSFEKNQSSLSQFSSSHRLTNYEINIKDFGLKRRMD